MYTIEKNISNEIIINKSKFITYLYKINSLEEINMLLENIKSNYKDATHHCYAFTFKNIKKANDDGEPLHTAGLPILNVLENKKLDNTLAVVVRYFGGIKLGAGGLVRAYTNAVTEALNKTNIIPLLEKFKLRIEFDYSNISKLNYLLRNYNITYKEYDNKVIYEFIYEENNYPEEIDNYIEKKTHIV